MEEGRMKKSATNIVFGYMNQILSLVLSFVSRTVFVYYFGAEYLGLEGLFKDVLGLLSLADLGFGTAMVYSFYKPLAEKDEAKIAALTTFYRRIYWIIGISVAVLGIAAYPLLPWLINLDTQIPNVSVYYFLALANVVLSYVCVYKTSVLTADQKGYMLSKVSMVISLVSTAVRVLAIVLTRNYILYLVLGVVMSLSQNLLASRKAQKEYPYLRKRVELSRGERKGILKTIGSVFLYKLFSVLMNATDNLLTSVLVGTVVVGYYSNYHMLQDKLAVLYTLIFTSMTASVGNLIVTEKEEKRYEVFSCQQSVSFIICAIVVPCYVILINDFIRVWLGAEFVLGGATVAAIGLNMYLSCVLQPLWSYREATGLYRKTKYIMLLCAVLNLVLSVIFGMLWGLTGILFASNVARLLTYIWYEPKVLFREYFNRKPGRYFVSLAGNLLLIAVVSVAGLAVGALLPAPSFLLWFVKACCVGLCCLGIAILVYSRSSGVKLLVERAKTFLADRRRKHELEDDR